MDVNELKSRIKVLRKESEDKKHERKVLAEDYDRQKEMVKKSGVTSLLTFLIHYVVLVPGMDSTKHVSLAGMARFLSPFVMIVFFASFIFFLIKGFDFFINTDMKYAKKLADKFDVTSVAEELKIMNETITMLDIEIKRLEEELYELGEDFAEQPKKVSQKNVTIAPGKIIEKPIVERTIIEKPKIVTVEADLDKNEFNKHSIDEKKNDIDDILNGLDDFMLDDDEDELENSSELWEKDAMRRFSKY